MANASHFPIVQYETNYASIAMPQGSPQPYGMRWTRKRSIDLRWVASAFPSGVEMTMIEMCGSGPSGACLIRADYPDFMRDWTRAKGL